MTGGDTKILELLDDNDRLWRQRAEACDVTIEKLKARICELEAMLDAQRLRVALLEQQQGGRS